MATPYDIFRGISAIRKDLPGIKKKIQEFVASAPKTAALPTVQSFLRQPKAKPLVSAKVSYFPEARPESIVKEPALKLRDLRPAKQAISDFFSEYVKQKSGQLEKAGEFLETAAQKTSEFLEEAKPSEEKPMMLPVPKAATYEKGIYKPGEGYELAPFRFGLPSESEMQRTEINLLQGALTTAPHLWSEALKSASRGEIVNTLVNSVFALGTSTPQGAAIAGAFNTETLKPAFEKTLNFARNGWESTLSFLGIREKIRENKFLPEKAKQELNAALTVAPDIALFEAARKVIETTTTKGSTIGKELEGLPKDQATGLRQMDPRIEVKVYRNWVKSLQDAVYESLDQFEKDPLGFIAERVPGAATIKDFYGEENLPFGKGKKKTPSQIKRERLMDEADMLEAELKKETGDLDPVQTRIALEQVKVSEIKSPKLKKEAAIKLKKIKELGTKIVQNELKQAGIAKVGMAPKFSKAELKEGNRLLEQHNKIVESGESGNAFIKSLDTGKRQLFFTALLKSQKPIQELLKPSLPREAEQLKAGVKPAVSVFKMSPKQLTEYNRLVVIDKIQAREYMNRLIEETKAKELPPASLDLPAVSPAKAPPGVLPEVKAVLPPEAVKAPLKGELPLPEIPGVKISALGEKVPFKAKRARLADKAPEIIEKNNLSDLDEAIREGLYSNPTPEKKAVNRAKRKKAALDVLDQADLPPARKQKLKASMAKFLAHEEVADKVFEKLLDDPLTREEVIKDMAERANEEAADIERNTREIPGQKLDAKRMNAVKDLYGKYLNGKLEWYKEPKLRFQVLKDLKTYIKATPFYDVLKYFGTVHRDYAMFPEYVRIQEEMLERISASVATAQKMWNRIFTEDVDPLTLKIASLDLLFRDLIRRSQDGQEVMRGLTPEELQAVYGEFVRSERPKADQAKLTEVLKRIESNRQNVLDQARDAGVNVTGLRQRSNYFPHKIVEQAALAIERFKRQYPRKTAKEKPGYLKEAVGSVRDINLDLPQVMMKFYADMEYANAVNKMVRDSVSEFAWRDSGGKIIRSAIRDNIGKIIKSGTPPEGYAAFTENPLQLFSTQVIKKGRLREAAEEGLSIEDILGDEQFGDMFIGVRKNSDIFLPKEIAQHLSEMIKNTPPRLKAWRGLTRLFKGAAIWKKPITYMLRNMIGDSWLAYAAASGYKDYPLYLMDLGNQLIRYAKNGTLTPDIEMIRDLGGFESGMFSDTFADGYLEGPLMKRTRNLYQISLGTAIADKIYPFLKRVVVTQELVSKVALAKTLGEGKITPESFREANYLLVAYNRFAPWRRTMDTLFPFKFGWPVGAAQTILRIGLGDPRLLPKTPLTGESLKGRVVREGLFRDPLKRAGFERALRTWIVLMGPRALSYAWQTGGNVPYINPQDKEKIAAEAFKKHYTQWSVPEIIAALDLERSLPTDRFIPGQFTVATNPMTGKPMFNSAGEVGIYTSPNPLEFLSTVTDAYREARTSGFWPAIAQQSSPILRSMYELISGTAANGRKLLTRLPKDASAQERVLFQQKLEDSLKNFFPDDWVNKMAENERYGWMQLLYSAGYVSNQMIPFINGNPWAELKKKESRGVLKTKTDYIKEIGRNFIPGLTWVNVSELPERVEQARLQKQIDRASRQEGSRQSLLMQDIKKNVSNNIRGTVLNNLKNLNFLTDEQINALPDYDKATENNLLKKFRAYVTDNPLMPEQKIAIMKDIINDVNTAYGRMFQGIDPRIKFYSFYNDLMDPEVQANPLKLRQSKEDAIKFLELAQNSPTLVMQLALDKEGLAQDFTNLRDYLATQSDTRELSIRITNDIIKNKAFPATGWSEVNLLGLFDKLVTPLLEEELPGVSLPGIVKGVKATAEIGKGPRINEPEEPEGLPQAFPGAGGIGLAKTSLGARKAPKNVEFEAVSFFPKKQGYKEPIYKLEPVRFTPTPLSLSQLPPVRLPSQLT